MATINTGLTGSCGLGLMYGFGYWDDELYIPDDAWDRPDSKHFIATFRRDQKEAFNKVCEKHTPIFTHVIGGAHGKYKIAFVLFKWGKT